MRIKDDLSNIDEFLASYEDRMKNYETHIRLDGRNIERANMEQPAYIGMYDQIKAELESSMYRLETQVKVARANCIIKTIKTASLAHGERMLDKMADADPQYLKVHSAYMEVRELAMKAKSIVDTLVQRGYSLNNIVKIQIAQLRDITIHER